MYRVYIFILSIITTFIYFKFIYVSKVEQVSTALDTVIVEETVEYVRNVHTSTTNIEKIRRGYEEANTSNIDYIFDELYNLENE